MADTKQKSRPLLTIDYRWSRIRVHRRTLRLLSDPDFIELLVNPDQKSIAVRGCLGGKDHAHHVDYDHLEKGMLIHSAYLLRSLQTVHPAFAAGKTYRLSGNMNAANDVAEFPMDTLQEI